METSEKNTALVFKAFCDENRIQILNILSSGEECACKLLEALSVTQPTLSHHMKVLSESGLVVARKEFKFTYYSISSDLADAILATISDIFGVEQVNIRTVVQEKIAEAPKKDLPSHLL